ncbi:pneumococcal-type histidine triad protein [Streptococcus sanguinis]|uniref:Pneumococcal-type histidine triad protein n=1 Tax=Streptococcus sanguinis TaxID=1305 RepID=A0A859EM28_STRSA|nr:pneumococcal-type histidine triad protein [Streptococcus sanguinis]EFX94360.1 histidine triad protein [Streptococcus sanguinis VMC66]QKQ43711.1 pneumococcal-type histidine triad protein [Streptococcus sanguinis]
MKKKYFLASAAVLALGLGTYGLIQWQSQPRPQTKNNKVAYIEDKTSGDKTDKNKNLTSEQFNDEEGIEAEQIVVKITDQGYVTSHGDHYHYFDGKVPFDAIISEELIIRDPNYTLQEADIVNEVKDGYIIKVEGKYYLYLKDAKHTSNVRSVDEIARQKKLHKSKEEGDSGKSSTTKSSRIRDFSQPSKSLAAGKTAADLAGVSYQGQGGYRTDDGYTFSPSDIIEDTGDAFIVPHGGHFHYIPKSDLSPAELAAAQSYWNSRQAGGRVNTPDYGRTIASSNTWNQNSAGNQGGSASNPSPELPNHSKIEQPSAGLATTQPSLSNPLQPSQPSQPSLPSLLQQLYALPQSQRYHEGDGVVFDPLKISRRTENGVVIPHGDHHHFIPYDKLSDLEAKIARLIPIGYTYEPLGDLLQALKPQLPSQPEHDHGFRSEAVIGKDDQGYMVSHGDHAHYFYKKDLTSEQIQAAEQVLAKQQPAKPSAAVNDAERYSRDASDEEKIAYICQTYGVPKEAVRISNGFFVFNNPDQAYDPTHIHPYAVRKEHVRIPLVTGNAELDFMNELYTTALRSGLSPYSLQVEDGQFVIPHGDHNHYIKIQSKGAAEALKNRLPQIQSKYEQGDYDEAAVLQKVESLKADSQRLYADDPLMQRRIELALGQFVETMKKLPSNSTAGYLSSLDNFDKQFIHVDQTVKPIQETELDKTYQGLLERMNRLDTDSYGLKKADLLQRLQNAYAGQNQAEMAELGQLLSALEDYHDRTGVTAVDYIRYFYQALEDGRLTPELRRKAAGLTLTLYKSQAFIEATNLQQLFPALYQTKKEITAALASGQPSPSYEKTELDQGEPNQPTYKAMIYDFLKGIYDDFGTSDESEKSAQALVFLGKAQELLGEVKDQNSRADYAARILELGKELKSSSSDKQALLAASQKLLDQMSRTIAGQKEEPANTENQEVYQQLYNLLMSIHQYLEKNQGSEQQYQQLDQLFDKLGQRATDKKELLKEILAFQQSLVHPEGANESDSQHREDDDYHFNLQDMVGADEQGYRVAHLDHEHYIYKKDLSEAERQAADAYAVQKGFLKAPAEQPASGQVASSSAPETAQTGNLPSESATGEAAQNQSDKPAEVSTTANPAGQSSLAASFGMSEEAFNQKLQELSQLYGVSPETFSYNAATRSISFTGADGQLKTVQIS